MAPRPDDQHGLVWRSVRRDDVEELSQLLTAIEHLDQPSERHSIDELYEQLDEADCDAEADTVIGRDAGGTLVAYGWNHPLYSDVDPRRVHLTGGVHPGWRRQGIGHALFAWQLDRARAWHAETYREGLGPLQVICAVDTKLADVRALYEQAGLEPVRWFADMTLRFEGAVPEFPPPAGIRLVPLSRKHFEAVRQAHNEAFADHWGSQPIDPTRWAEQLARSASRVSWSWVALVEQTSEVVGYATNAAYEQDWGSQGFSEGWTDRLGVRPGWRGRGIAKALLGASMRSFAEAGLDAAGLGVDTDSPTGAFGLYESMGYRATDTNVMYAVRHRDAFSGDEQKD
ncbi:MAG TPA: GNAT family N-acetyltransferase [Microlunatus sp.]|nr:GNAT family N-acetyltransferase [Microlunatus sp.]